MKQVFIALLTAFPRAKNNELKNRGHPHWNSGKVYKELQRLRKKELIVMSQIDSNSDTSPSQISSLGIGI